MKERLYLFDTTKFILIFLVVFGHMLEVNRSLSYNSELFGCIYLFHMPLFIFISGFFSRRYNDKRLFWMSELRLTETFVIFHVGALLFKSFVQGSPLGISDLVVPAFGSWYLLSLIFWRAILQFAPKGIFESKWLIPVCVAISLIGGFVPIGGVFSFQRTVTFLPFFMLGYLIKERNWLEKTRINHLLAGVLLVVIFTSVFMFNDLGNGVIGYTNLFHHVMMGACSYFKNSDYVLSLFLYRAVFLVLSTITCCAVLSVVPTKHIPILTDKGKDTLFFYVYHAFVFRLLLMLYPVLSIEKTSLNIFIGAIVVMAILILLNKIPFLHSILNPVTRKLN